MDGASDEAQTAISVAQLLRSLDLTDPQIQDLIENRPFSSWAEIERLPGFDRSTVVRLQAKGLAPDSFTGG